MCELYICYVITNIGMDDVCVYVCVYMQSMFVFQ